jgi:hypothetical protein
MNSTAVISLCNSSHIDVWKLTSELLPRHIKANSYRVYVPVEEIDLFRKVSPSVFEVLPQNDFGKEYFESLRQSCSLANNVGRFGWYLQQFLKIEILLASPEELLVIWDSDCVPLKPITTFDSTGQPIYMLASNEYNETYFENIERLLAGLKRIQDFSFVIPSFPVKKLWVQELIGELSERNRGDAWWKAIIDSTDFSLRSGFSETETIGTWVANKYPGQWSTYPGKWERRGQKEFGYARNFSVEKLLRRTRKHSLDIVSFENWDVRGFKLVYKRLKEMFTGC